MNECVVYSEEHFDNIDDVISCIKNHERELKNEKGVKWFGTYIPMHLDIFRLSGSYYCFVLNEALLFWLPEKLREINTSLSIRDAMSLTVSFTNLISGDVANQLKMAKQYPTSVYALQMSFSVNTVGKENQFVVEIDLIEWRDYDRHTQEFSERVSLFSLTRKAVRCLKC